VVPVNGKFSKRQKEVYDAVLRVHNSLKSQAKAGIYLKDLEALKNELIIGELITLRLCTTNEVKEKGMAHYLNHYSYHGFGHYLGLDVHDVGDNYQKLPANGVITIEPGIYIWEEKIGVRLENNVVLRNEGMIDLMADIPLETEEIEELMNT
jgi:Xaa-Pro aminopeptidase